MTTIIPKCPSTMEVLRGEDMDEQTMPMPSRQKGRDVTREQGLYQTKEGRLRGTIVKGTERRTRRKTAPKTRIRSRRSGYGVREKENSRHRPHDFRFQLRWIVSAVFSQYDTIDSPTDQIRQDQTHQTRPHQTEQNQPKNKPSTSKKRQKLPFPIHQTPPPTKRHDSSTGRSTKIQAGTGRIKNRRRSSRDGRTTTTLIVVIPVLLRRLSSRPPRVFLPCMAFRLGWRDSEVPHQGQ